MLALNHGAPIESLAFFQAGACSGGLTLGSSAVPHFARAGCAGSLLVTAGGTQLCVWDLYGGGRLLHRLANHQKTVTSVVLSRGGGAQSSGSQQMLSASLDGHVKARTGQLLSSTVLLSQSVCCGCQLSVAMHRLWSGAGL